MSRDHLHIQHIMWQPQFTCGSQCSNCYISNSVAGAYEGELVTDILSLTFEEKKVQCGQLTISLDGLPCEIKTLAPILRELWDYLEKEEDTTEICVTVRDLPSLAGWARAMGLSKYSFLLPLTMLSVSRLRVPAEELKDVAALCSGADTVLNYNLLLQLGRNGKVIPADIAPLEYVDSTYLLLPKKPLGAAYHTRHYDFYQEVLDQTPELSGPSVHKDDCITEVTRYIKHGWACSAGIHKVAVWPNGGVTACPYDTNGVSTERQDTWEGLKKAIAPGSKKIKRCQLVDPVATRESQQDTKKDRRQQRPATLP